MKALDDYHGTHGGYTNHGCRCDLCRAEHTSYTRQYREREGRAERQRELNRESDQRRRPRQPAAARPL